MSAPLDPVGQRARRRIAFRLLPLVLAMYVVCYIDRANVAFANLRMSADLGFSDRVYGLGVGLFFVGYFLFEIPGALIVERWSARKWMARIMITWGLVTIYMGFIHTARQFYVARLLVGISEASFFPGIIVYLTHWFRASDRAKAIGFFYTAVPGSFIVGSFAASWLLGVHWLTLAGWRWLFILEGVPPIVLGVIALFFMTDWPREARWLPEDERVWITRELESETRTKKAARDFTMWQAFRDPRIVVMSVAWSLALVSLLATTYWAPTFLKRLTHLPDTRVALLGSIAGIIGVTGTLLNGWHSDKTGERRWHATLPLAAAGISCLLLLVPSHSIPVTAILLALVTGFHYTFQSVFWAMPTEILCESAAAASFGLINSIGQIGGLVGPYAVSSLNQRTGSLGASFIFIGATYLLAASVLTLLGALRPVSRTLAAAPAG